MENSNQDKQDKERKGLFMQIDKKDKVNILLNLQIVEPDLTDLRYYPSSV